MYCCKILGIIKKLMNFFLNLGLISLNTAPTTKNIFLMIAKVLYNSSSNSPSVQVLHKQIRGGGWVKTCDDLVDTRGGVQNLGKPADVILECSLKLELKHSHEFVTIFQVYYDTSM